MPVSTYLNQTAQIKVAGGYDAYGKPSLGSATTIECRFQHKQNRLIDNEGTEFVTDAEMWVKPTQTINLDDVIVFESSNYKVVRVDTKKGFTGDTDHKKVYLRVTKE